MDLQLKPTTQDHKRSFATVQAWVWLLRAEEVYGLGFRICDSAGFALTLGVHRSRPAEVRSRQSGVSAASPASSSAHCW